MISITIDGPSGSGKSSAAELLAQRLGFYHLNTGKMYRATTYGCLKRGISYEDADAVANYLANCDLRVEFVDGVQQVYLEGEEVTPYLKLNDVSINTPKYSICPAVREGLSNMTRELAKKYNIVLDGRDSGSYVLPNATYKFYLDASVYERAKRRHKELVERGEEVPVIQLIEQIEERDRFDKAKKIAPLVIPEGAIIVDNSLLNLEETVDKLQSYIHI